MKPFLKKPIQHWPLVVALIALWIAISLLIVVIIKKNQGVFVYAIDDPYIHMAMAKNFAQHGVWGITNQGYTSTTSSPLWTFLLAITYFITGIHDISPLVLNILFSSLIIVVTYIILLKNKSPHLLSLAVLSAIIFFVPLPVLVLVGMEHAMQILFLIPYFYFAAGVISEDDQRSITFRLRWLLLITPFFVLIRFEALFLVFTICILMIIRKRWLHSLLIAIAALVPHVIYSIVSVANGWFWLPTSLVLKGSMPKELSVTAIAKYFGLTIYVQLTNNNFLALLLVVALILFIVRVDLYRNKWDKGQIMLVLFLVPTLLHLQFAQIGWWYRYEAYIIAIAIIVFALTAMDLLPKRADIGISRWRYYQKWTALTILMLIIVIPFVSRSFVAFKQTPQVSNNTYEQNYMIGEFVNRFYQGKILAVNDIGAINYLADIDCLDIWGLGTIEVARMKNNHNYSIENLEETIRLKGVSVAIFNSDFKWSKNDQVPKGWIEVGRWKNENMICTNCETVHFFAIDPTEEEWLKESLMKFAHELPPTVLQSGKYTEVDPPNETVG